MSVRIAIGVGCRLGTKADAIEALVLRALAQIPDAKRLGLCSICDKRGEPGLLEAASRLGLDLIWLSHDVLRDQAPSLQTRSARVEERFGVPSVAEASALAGVGAGAVLLVARIAAGGVTCAIAAGGVTCAIAAGGVTCAIAAGGVTEVIAAGGVTGAIPEAGS